MLDQVLTHGLRWRPARTILMTSPPFGASAMIASHDVRADVVKVLIR